MKLTKSDAGTYIQLSEVYSSTSTLSLSTQELGPPGLVPVSSEYIS